MGCVRHQAACICRYVDGYTSTQELTLIQLVLLSIMMLLVMFWCTFNCMFACVRPSVKIHMHTKSPTIASAGACQAASL